MEIVTTRKNDQQLPTTMLTESLTQCSELSLYSGLAPATPEEVKTEIKKLTSCFPQVPAGMIVIMVERIIDNKISLARLKDSVNYLIDNFKYPIPTVADVLSFDKKVRIYTHAEVCKSIQDGLTFNDYNMITINNEKRWTLK